MQSSGFVYGSDSLCSLTENQSLINYWLEVRPIMISDLDKSYFSVENGVM